MHRVFLRLFALLALIVTVVASSARAARAEEPVLASPHDVPLVLQPARVTIPPVPDRFEKREVGGWLTLSFPPGASERVAPLLHDADEIKQKLEAELGQPVLAKVEVRVARSPEEMAELAPTELPPPTYASGVAYPPLHFVLLSMIAPGSNQGVDLDDVFRHELAHVALEDATLGHHVPRWFNEGLAVHESNELPWERRRVLWDAALSGSVLALDDLDRNFPDAGAKVNIAYAESVDFVQFLMRDADQKRFTSLIERVRAGTPFDRALADAYGTDLHRLEYQWKEELGRRFKLMPVLTGTGTVGAIMAALLVAAWVKRRRRARAKLAEWAREEAAIDAAIAAASSTDEEAPPAPEPSIAARARAVPMVHHDGRWYTLH
jgi:hypothetical protein